MSEMDAREYLTHPSRMERHEPGGRAMQILQTPVVMKYEISGDD